MWHNIWLNFTLFSYHVYTSIQQQQLRKITKFTPSKDNKKWNRQTSENGTVDVDSWNERSKFLRLQYKWSQNTQIVLQASKLVCWFSHDTWKCFYQHRAGLAMHLNIPNSIPSQIYWINYIANLFCTLRAMNTVWNEKTFRLSNLFFTGENFKRFTYFGSRHGRYFDSRCTTQFSLWWNILPTIMVWILSLFKSNAEIHHHFILFSRKLNNIQQTSYRHLQTSTANMRSNLSSGNKNNFSYLKHIHNETITRLYLFSACSCLYM